MSIDEPQTARYRKPNLSRAQPIRRLGGVRGRETPQPAAASTLHAAPVTPATVADGVRAGYQVIEDYLRQGRESAEQTRAAPPPSAAAAPHAPDKLTERFFQYAHDMTAVWLELMQATVLGAVQPSAAGQGAGAGPFELRSAKTPAAVSSKSAHPALACAIQLRSARPVEARCELFEDASCELSLGELRAQDPSLPNLGGVTLSRDGRSGRLLVGLRIDPMQPAAAYSGLILDRATQAPAGIVHVRVWEESV